MKTQSSTLLSSALPGSSPTAIITGLLSVFLLCFALQSSYADSATWNLNPSGSDWLTATNWTPATVPNAPGVVATFGVSNTTDVTMSGEVKVGSIVFSPGASAYTIDAEGNDFFQDGGSIQNNSGITQNMIGTGLIYFDGGAGDQMAYTMTGGLIDFYDAATGGSSTFTVNGGGTIHFQLHATGGDSTLIANEGSNVMFSDRTTAGNATIRMIDGALSFDFHGDGGTARVRLLNTSSMDISAHTATPLFNIGSIEGDGSISLGGNSLTVGGNNLSTVYSGVIRDGGTSGGTGGSMVKTGTGTLTLTNGHNSYTGGTAVKRGILIVANTTGSATGTGPVTILGGGTLGGTGKIAGPISVGTLATSGVLDPGDKATPGTIKTNGTVLFDAHGVYNVEVRTVDAVNDELVANGVTINGSAQINIHPLGTNLLAIGTVLTLISNDAASPILGTIANLPDGSMVTIGNNTFQANYEGGDGNDLTLTVVP